MLDNVFKNPGFWTISGPKNDIVLSSRVRLARNMDTVPFSNRMDDGDYHLVRVVMEKFARESAFNDNTALLDIHDMDSNKKRLLRERNIITYEMEVSDSSLVAVNDEYDFTILVNDEDHFRIQVIRSGLQLMEAYRLADRIDDTLNSFTSYAFSEEFGFLTDCPSNLGTGLRASVLVHLPVLSMKNKLDDTIHSLSPKDIIINGTLGADRNTLGSIYQVSNRISFGLSEVDIIEMVDDMVNRLINVEDRERDLFLSESKTEIEDKIWRSYGLLQYSRKINFVEAMDHLSFIRLGVVLAVVKNIDIGVINNLMVNTQWSHLQRHFNTIFKSTVECDEHRAEYLRMHLE